MLPAAASANGSANSTPENRNSGNQTANHVGKTVRDLVRENAVMVFGRKGCCMCHVLKLLLQGHGVNPTILEVDDKNEADVTRQWSAFFRKKSPAAASALPNFPAVFVGGELFGGLDEIMGAHITGELVPKLKAAGALWL